jgi:hypothetical protein
MRTYFNKHRKEISFNVGDLVLLDSRNIKLASTATKKLQPRYLGPFKILKRVGRVSYKLALPRQTVHPVFHVSLLKAY